MTEEWRDIPGAFGYQVSCLGRVRSVDRTIVEKTGQARRVKGRVLSPGCHSAAHPYPTYNLRLDGKPKRTMVGAHRLVAWAFIGPQPKGYHACHKDGDPTNPRWDNIYYGTPKQNAADRHLHGTAMVREKHPGAKITPAQLAAILKRLANGDLQREIAADFGITQGQVSHIKTGRHWK